MKGSMLKKATRTKRGDKAGKRSSSPTKVLFQEPVGHNLPPSLQNFRWNVDKVERKLQEKIQEKTKIAGNFVYQQAYRLLECTRGEGIDFVSFKEQLRIKFGIILEDAELQLLFDKYDEDRNGTIDLNEFIRRVLPPDYNYGRQWFEISQQQSDEKQAALKRESRHEFLSGMGVIREDLDNTGETSNWTLESLMKHIQMKVLQRTPSGDDQYRRAFKMLRSGRDQGIRIKDLRSNLKNKFGIYVSEKQMHDIFSQFDGDGSGEIDLKEFLQFVEAPAYPPNSKVPNGLWTKDDDSESDKEEAEQDITRGHDEDCTERRRLGGAAAGEAENEKPLSSARQVIKKERPMSANPKKTAMLKQRREQQQRSSTSQLLQRHLGGDDESRETVPIGTHSVTKTTQTRRMSVSLADIHAAPRHLERLQGGHGNATAHGCAAEVPSDCHSIYSSSSTGSGGGARPRSAGSVASSRVSVSGSVRGAAYLARPSTPQNLRQKCLESRLAGVALQEPMSKSSAGKIKKRASMGPTVYIESSNERQSGGTGQQRSKMKQSAAESGPRRHTFSDTATLAHGRSSQQQQQLYGRHPEDDEGGEVDNYAPRVVRVHPKQQDNRPYSQEGKILLRSKTTSAGCR